MQHFLQHHIYDPLSVSVSHKIPDKDVIVYGCIAMKYKMVGTLVKAL